MKTALRVNVSKVQFRVQQAPGARTTCDNEHNVLNDCVSSSVLALISQLAPVCARETLMLIALIFFLFTICNYKVM